MSLGLWTVVDFALQAAQDDGVTPKVTREELAALIYAANLAQTEIATSDLKRARARLAELELLAKNNDTGRGTNYQLWQDVLAERDRYIVAIEATIAYLDGGEIGEYLQGVLAEYLQGVLAKR